MLVDGLVLDDEKHVTYQHISYLLLDNHANSIKQKSPLFQHKTSVTGQNIKSRISKEAHFTSSSLTNKG